MNIKRLAGLTILLFAILGFTKAGRDIYLDLSSDSRSGSVVSVASTPVPGNGDYVIFFFEGNSPCSVCDRIRTMTREMLGSGSGALDQFIIREVNVETPGNEKYVLDLELYSTSVVLALESDGRITRWKNLEKVWDLAGNENGFREYMASEAKAFLQEGKQQ